MHASHIVSTAGARSGVRLPKRGLAARVLLSIRTMNPHDRGRRISGTRPSAFLSELASEEDLRIVVVAEDEDDLRLAIAELLEDAGFVVVDVADVSRLRRVLANLTPLALLLDFHLRDDSSDALIGELAGTTLATRTVLMSASPEARAAAARHGVTLMPKPFDIEQLLSTIEAISARAA